MEKQERIFFDLLRYCISCDREVPSSLCEVDWQRMYDIADKQALWAIVFAGVSRIFEDKAGVEVPAMPKELMLKWYGMSERIRKRNVEMNGFCRAVSAKFRKEGFENCVLKGQGMAMLYPDPLNRTPGDIDIWLDGGRKRIVEYVNKVCPGQIMRYHHIDFPAVRNVDIEVHFTPSYMHNPFYNRRMHRWFERVKGLQFANVEEKGGFTVPLNGFNRVYIMSHLFRHLFSEGIGLRQLLDYYYVLRQGCSEAERAETVKVIRWLGMGKFAGGVMYVLSEIFGLEERYLLMSPDAKEGRFLLDEIMIGGNFGKYDARLGDKAKEGKVRRYFRMTIRNLGLVWRYPSESLVEPVFRTWFFFWRICQKK